MAMLTMITMKTMRSTMTLVAMMAVTTRMNSDGNEDDVFYPLLFLSKTLKASLMSSSKSVSFSFLAIMERNSSKSISPLPSLSTCVIIVTFALA